MILVCIYIFVIIRSSVAATIRSILYRIVILTMLLYCTLSRFLFDIVFRRVMMYVCSLLCKILGRHNREGIGCEHFVFTRSEILYHGRIRGDIGHDSAHRGILETASKGIQSFFHNYNTIAKSATVKKIPQAGHIQAYWGSTL